MINAFKYNESYIDGWAFSVCSNWKSQSNISEELSFDASHSSSSSSSSSSTSMIYIVVVTSTVQSHPSLFGDLVTEISIHCKMQVDLFTKSHSVGDIMDAAWYIMLTSLECLRKRQSSAPLPNEYILCLCAFVPYVSNHQQQQQPELSLVKANDSHRFGYAAALIPL
uniref:Uncharacterized protein n=1 Tax=Glossina austeni TaxID=7395 RepID=A0A1A9VH52_GLOAU